MATAPRRSPGRVRLSPGRFRKFRVLGFRVLGFLGFRVLGVLRVLSGFRVLGFRDLGLRVLGFRIQRFGFIGARGEGLEGLGSIGI